MTHTLSGVHVPSSCYKPTAPFKKKKKNVAPVTATNTYKRTHTHTHSDIQWYTHTNTHTHWHTQWLNAHTHSDTKAIKVYRKAFFLLLLLFYFSLLRGTTCVPLWDHLVEIYNLFLIWSPLCFSFILVGLTKTAFFFYLFIVYTSGVDCSFRFSSAFSIFIFAFFFLCFPNRKQTCVFFNILRSLGVCLTMFVCAFALACCVMNYERKDVHIIHIHGHGCCCCFFFEQGSFFIDPVTSFLSVFVIYLGSTKPR